MRSIHGRNLRTHGSPGVGTPRGVAERGEGQEEHEDPLGHAGGSSVSGLASSSRTHWHVRATPSAIPRRSRCANFSCSAWALRAWTCSARSGIHSSLCGDAGEIDLIGTDQLARDGRCIGGSSPRHPGPDGRFSVIPTELRRVILGPFEQHYGPVLIVMKRSAAPVAVKRRVITVPFRSDAAKLMV